MKSQIRVFYKYSIYISIIICGYLYADPPNWEDDPGSYQYTATINTKILGDDQVMGNSGDMFAAFDQDGNVRGIGTPLIIIGTDTPYWEIQVRSNASNDQIYFKYYSASEDAISNIIENYSFVNNNIQGSALSPINYNLEFIKLSFGSFTDTTFNIQYDSNTYLAGYQFTVSGVEVTGASGGDSDDVGFNITNGNNTILGFSLSGSVLEDGSGTLVTIEFSPAVENTIIEIHDVVLSGSGGTMIANNSPLESPLLFSYNISTLQAFYFFRTVLIGENEIDSKDWVGAFNGNICVGARQWDISKCGEGGVCDLPAMGDDGNNNGLTNGYLTAGDMPAFKIYDASENKYYDAIPSKEEAWQSMAINDIDLLYVEFDECGIYNGNNTGCLELNYNTCSCIGCTDPDACNFSENAKYDDGGCWSAADYKDCTGQCIAEGEGLDEDGLDCEGVCGGTIRFDECGICGGNDSTCKDCLGIVNGNNLEDNCGTCDADASNDCAQGCDGVWGSGKTNDICGICGGDDSTCKDCNGVVDGLAFLDGCDACVGGNTTLEACPTDCNNIDGGPSFTNDCGDCVENGDEMDQLCIEGCDGIWKKNGTQLLDDLCNVCGGNGTTCLDCQGVINGDNVVDNCGTCDSDSSNDCVKGCDGVWGSGQVLDRCSVCNGNGCHEQDCYTYPTTDYACNGTCIAVGEGLDEDGLDCNGNCNGLYLPNFTCEVDEDGNVVYACTPSDCLDIELLLKPNDFGINKIFPNPFNPIANIDFKISQLSLVTLNIYDITGRKIVNVLDDYRAPGNYQISWNAGDNASGIYIIEIISQNNNNINRDLKKILYLK